MSRQGICGRNLSSDLGQSTWKSTQECIGIRAQLRNPINTQLPRRKTQAVGEAEREIWVAEGFILFFFSFLFFSFLFFYFGFIFWSWMLSFRVEAESRIPFFSNYYMECLKFRQISGIRLSQFQFTVVSF